MSVKSAEAADGPNMDQIEKVDWRSRLNEVIEKDGRSHRAITDAIGLSPSYIHGILKEGKDPRVRNLVKLAKELNTSLNWIMFGIQMTGDVQRLLCAFSSFDDNQKQQFLRIVDAVTALAVNPNDVPDRLLET